MIVAVIVWAPTERPVLMTFPVPRLPSTLEAQIIEEERLPSWGSLAFPERLRMALWVKIALSDGDRMLTLGVPSSTVIFVVVRLTKLVLSSALRENEEPAPNAPLRLEFQVREADGMLPSSSSDASPMK